VLSGESIQVSGGGSGCGLGWGLRRIRAWRSFPGPLGELGELGGQPPFHEVGHLLLQRFVLGIKLLDPSHKASHSNATQAAAGPGCLWRYGSVAHLLLFSHVLERELQALAPVRELLQQLFLRLEV
jgi:hypothetical protein